MARGGGAGRIEGNGDGAGRVERPSQVTSGRAAGAGVGVRGGGAGRDPRQVGEVVPAGRGGGPGGRAPVQRTAETGWPCPGASQQPTSPAAQGRQLPARCARAFRSPSNAPAGTVDGAPVPSFDPQCRGARPPRDEVLPMPEPTPSRPVSDRNLLFGILA